MTDNAIGADNQQGRLDPWWISGFVDGEGCFAVSVFRNMTTTSGYQVFPEFVVTQGTKSLSVLEELQNFFQCGNVYRNIRHDNHRECLHRYCVRSLEDLRLRIIPFFKEYPLRTAKRDDFQTFCTVITMVEKKRTSYVGRI